MLSSMMRHKFGKGGAGENFGKLCQWERRSMMQFLVEKSAVKNQDRKTCSVA